jgi:hypothetical protein
MPNERARATLGVGASKSKSKSKSTRQMSYSHACVRAGSSRALMPRPNSLLRTVQPYRRLPPTRAPFPLLCFVGESGRAVVASYA